MAAADDDEGHQPKGTPPLLILHHLPNFKLPIFPLLRARYTVLDPSDEPPNPSFPTLSKAARLMLCAGPTPVTADDLDRYPALECVIGSSAGVNHFDLAACRRRGVRLTTAGDSFSDDVADYAVGLAIDVLRRVSAADRFVRAGSWPVRKEYGLGAKEVESSNSENNSVDTAGRMSLSGSNLSRYEDLKQRDSNTFGQYLKNHRAPVSLEKKRKKEALAPFNWKRNLRRPPKKSW